MRKAIWCCVVSTLIMGASCESSKEAQWREKNAAHKITCPKTAPVQRKEAANKMAKLVPANTTQFFALLGTRFSLCFEVKGALPSREYVILNYCGKQRQKGVALLENNTLKISLNLNRGYYEVFFPWNGQRFGLCVIEEFRGRPDPFFCMDSSLSWLVDGMSLRKQYIEILKRSGIDMSRERLSWGEINPSSSKWNWEGRKLYESTRRLYKEIGVNVLELFHDAPKWLRDPGPYPEDYHKTILCWKTIFKRFRGCVQAIEVWNEPDGFGFSGGFPA